MSKCNKNAKSTKKLLINFGNRNLAPFKNLKQDC